MSEFNLDHPLAKENRRYYGAGFRWFLVILAAVVVLTVILTIGAFALSWFSTGVGVVSPQNVTTQFHDAYSRFEGLKATACNVKQERTLVTQAGGPTTNIGAQYQAQETAYEQNYRRVAADYQAAYDNAFEAKHVGPRDLPNPAPELEVAISDYC